MTLLPFSKAKFRQKQGSRGTFCIAAATGNFAKDRTLTELFASQLPPVISSLQRTAASMRVVGASIILIWLCWYYLKKYFRYLPLPLRYYFDFCTQILWRLVCIHSCTWWCDALRVLAKCSHNTSRRSLQLQSANRTQNTNWTSNNNILIDTYRCLSKTRGVLLTFPHRLPSQRNNALFWPLFALNHAVHIA